MSNWSVTLQFIVQTPTVVADWLSLEHQIDPDFQFIDRDLQIIGQIDPDFQFIDRDLQIIGQTVTASASTHCWQPRLTSVDS